MILQNIIIFIELLLILKINCYHSSGSFESVINPTPIITSWPLVKAYPNIEFNIRIGAVGGKYPYQYTLTTFPTGMLIDEDTGTITWTPISFGSITVSVKVTDTLGGIDTQTWDIEVTTTGFLFVDSNSGLNTNLGTLSSPFQTLSHAVLQGTSEDDIIYLRTGTYSGDFSLTSGSIHRWIKYPQENPIIDMQQSAHFNPRRNYLYIDGLEMINAYNYLFRIEYSLDHMVWRRNKFHSLTSSGSQSNHGFMMFTDFSNHQPEHTYNIIQDNEMYDATGINNGGSFVFFDVGWALVEDNHIHDIDAPSCFGDKDDGFKNTFRRNVIHDCAEIGLWSQYTQNSIEINDNVIYNEVKIQIGSQPGWIKNIDIHNNNFYNSGISFRSPVHHSESGSIYIQDNIFSMNNDEFLYDIYPRKVMTGETTYVYDGEYVFPPDKTIIDNNLIFVTKTDIAGYSWGLPNWNLEEWRVYGKDVNSITEDPLYVDPGNGDLSVPTNSPVIGKALDGGNIGNSGDFKITPKDYRCGGLTNSQGACGNDIGHGSCTGLNQCSCTSYWSGISCEVPRCDSPVCNDHEYCSDLNICLCRTGWEGQNCEIPQCASECQGNSECSAPNICSCIEGWTGSNCDVVEGTCTPLCNVNQECNPSNTCICKNGYEGNVCDVPTCVPKCKTNQNCSSPNSCTCFRGWVGIDCSSRDCAGHFAGVYCDECQHNWEGDECSTYLLSGNWTWVLPTSIVSGILGLFVALLIVVLFIVIYARKIKKGDLKAIQITSTEELLEPASKCDVEVNVKSDMAQSVQEK